MLAGILLFTVASALCGTAATLWLLIAARSEAAGEPPRLNLAVVYPGEPQQASLQLMWQW